MTPERLRRIEDLIAFTRESLRPEDEPFIATATDLVAELVAALRPYVFDSDADAHPCRCGETHRGMYAVNDWMHHNCDHRVVACIDPGTIWEIALCAHCGAPMDVDVIRDHPEAPQPPTLDP